MSHDPVFEDMLRAIIEEVGDDPFRDGLIDTPQRVQKSWKELYGGYAQDPKEILAKTFESDNDRPVVLREIEFYSTCEHHMLPFFGKADIAYVPNGRVVGISKLARLVNCFARRLQIQEQMTQEIGQALMKHLDCKGVFVRLEAKHFCMMARGIRNPSASMITTWEDGIIESADILFRYKS